MKEFSSEELLEFHYNEMAPGKRFEIQQELALNWSLNQKMEVIREAAKRLDRSIESPRPQVVDSILKYAGKRSKAAI